MTQYEFQLIKTAVGIHLIRDAAEQTRSLNLIDNCINKWCNFISDILHVDKEEIYNEGYFISNKFTSDFINSPKYTKMANDIMKTLIWLNILPGYIK